jgi:hypothetical protein
MPANRLQLCRNVLERTYREKLGLEFSRSIAEIGKGRQPVWRIVSADDLTSEIRPAAAGAAGLLLDPEIGLLSYILPFDQSTNLRKQVKLALGLRSRLSTERNLTSSDPEHRDPYGAWRVVLCWLVDESARHGWSSEVMAVRRETGFSEELSFDAIFLNDAGIEAQIEEYGFPRLLLTTREVFKKQRLEDMAKWLSANELVKNALVEFGGNFHKPEQRELANDVEHVAQTFSGTSIVAGNGLKAPSTPQTLRTIRINNFRNLREVSMDFGPDMVGASIVHGPNGTGKSSLCEALSVALFQSSFRYKWFADRMVEKDVTSVDRSREYLVRYLTPVDEPNVEPKIALNGHPLTRPQLIHADKTQQVDLEMCGTILTQEASLEFTRMASHELGARVLRGYSDLAEQIEEFTEGRMAQANAGRQEFLRGLGLSASITKIDTAYERIAKRDIDRFLPVLPNGLISWLEVNGKLGGDSNRDLARQWRAWGDEPSRLRLAREVAISSNALETVVRNIREWLERFNELIFSSAEVVKNTEARVEAIHEELEQAADRIKLWGEWLENRIQLPETDATREATNMEKALQDLQERQRKVLERGRDAAAHYEHLTQVEAYVREGWSKGHPNDCPTCGTNHAKDGGILKVVESLRTQTAAERDQLREDFGKLKSEIDKSQKKLTEIGRAQCPVSADEQSTLSEALQWLIPSTTTLSQWIAIKSQRETLLSVIGSLRQIPTVPATVKTEAEADRLGQRLLSEFREAVRTFEAPNNWKPVKDKLATTLAGIVNEHLPNTLARLWCELALNLTSAPWLLLERPRIAVVTKRGYQASTVLVKDRLARYILNQAENHTLGLAWFFARYLTRGRFFHACIVMDDPAHELDQTSYRDLCRLWETLVRLHRVYERPLRLVVMLNQESRAVEAARATSGILAVLDWERDQGKAISSISVIGEGFYAPRPTSLFEKTGT